MHSYSIGLILRTEGLAQLTALDETHPRVTK